MWRLFQPFVLLQTSELVRSPGKPGKPWKTMCGATFRSGLAELCPVCHQCHRYGQVRLFSPSSFQEARGRPPTSDIQVDWQSIRPPFKKSFKSFGRRYWSWDVLSYFMSIQTKMIPFADFLLHIIDLFVSVNQIFQAVAQTRSTSNHAASYIPPSVDVVLNVLLFRHCSHPLVYAAPEFSRGWFPVLTLLAFQVS